MTNLDVLLAVVAVVFLILGATGVVSLLVGVAVAVVCLLVLVFVIGLGGRRL